MDNRDSPLLKRVHSSDASQVILCQDFAVMYPGPGGLCVRCVLREFCEMSKRRGSHSGHHGNEDGQGTWTCHVEKGKFPV